MSRFYFGGSDSSSDLEDDNLPYPKPLARSSFLTPEFSPTVYLSSLHNRYQTLEDLRTELRTRSQDLSKELLDLVNTNYQDFLTLGSSLHGGEEKIEEVRVGLLGFKRDVEGVRKKVDEKEKEVGRLVGERSRLREDISIGRGLLEVRSRLEELEALLMVDSDKRTIKPDEGESDYSDTDNESDEEMDEVDSTDVGSMSTIRLHKLAQKYLYITHLVGELGSEHPFLIAHESRMIRLRNTLLLDLGTALKQAKGGGQEMSGRLLKIMSVYKDIDEAGEAVRILREIKA
ncbi:MAG: hypothetical protein M1837_001445 [Sclerophora amabilis]|nr:MAG: hypothetical protein M1837_001445 [Sclerophora amabilis]